MFLARITRISPGGCIAPIGPRSTSARCSSFHAFAPRLFPGPDYMGTKQQLFHPPGRQFRVPARPLSAYRDRTRLSARRRASASSGDIGARMPRRMRGSTNFSCGSSRRPVSRSGTLGYRVTPKVTGHRAMALATENPHSRRKPGSTYPATEPLKNGSRLSPGMRIFEIFRRSRTRHSAEPLNVA